MPTGAMITFYIPQGVAEKIALPGGEEPAELHVTLAYLGEAADIDEPEKLRRQVKAFAETHQPFRASIGGIGRFNNTDEGAQAFYASLDAAGLPKMRQRLMEMLEDAGFSQESEWGFTPHITLAYIKPGQPNPLNEIDREEFTIDTVSLVLAGNREDFTLGEVAKVVEGGSWNGYLDIIKVIDEEQRIIEGVASAPTPDGQAGQWNGQSYEADVVEPDAIRQALPDFMRWANLREMHQASAAGLILDAWISEEPVQVDGKLIEKPLMIRARVVDDNAWRKVREGVYKGFSIGGKVTQALVGKLGSQIVRFIKALKLVEISLVDRPQNPDARILLWKGDFEMAETKTEKTDAGKMDNRKAAIQALAAMRGEYEEKGDWKTAAGCSRAMQMVAGFGMPRKEGEEEETEKVELPEDIKALLKFDDESLTKAVQPVQDSLAKVLEVVNPLTEQLKTAQETLTKMEGRLEKIEQQPVGGGPAARVPADKTLPTDSDKPKGSPTITKAQLAELKQQANTHPDPALRASYNRQYTQALEALAA